MRLEGKNGLVTAAGSGMGRAGAFRFAKEGAAVGVVDIDEAAVAAVVEEIEEAGGKAVGIVADLTKDEDSKRIVRETANALGGLDFVWNHVGHPGPVAVLVLRGKGRIDPPETAPRAHPSTPQNSELRHTS